MGEFVNFVLFSLHHLPGADDVRHLLTHGEAIAETEDLEHVLGGEGDILIVLVGVENLVGFVNGRNEELALGPVGVPLRPIPLIPVHLEKVTEVVATLINHQKPCCLKDLSEGPQSEFGQPTSLGLPPTDGVGKEPKPDEAFERVLVDLDAHVRQKRLRVEVNVLGVRALTQEEVCAVAENSEVQGHRVRIVLLTEPPNVGTGVDVVAFLVADLLQLEEAVGGDGG